MTFRPSFCPSPSGGATSPSAGRLTGATDFALTVEDRLGIERLLHDTNLGHAPNPAILWGFLRYKLRASRGAPEPAPATLIVSGSDVTYMISGGGARSGTMHMSATPYPGCLIVGSMLGATLIGLRALQKVPLLRNDGQIETLVVLDVKSP